MLRITNEPDGDGRVRLRLEGRLTGPWVDELRRVYAGLLPAFEGRPPAFVLDLAEVSFVDGAGIALVRALAREGVLFANPSAFVAEQLKEVSDAQG
jgi:ABC-type transporter Mla MlaB component